ncbi:MAG: DUF5063 domain-containing protein [Verrucomicrobiota bacterium]
MTQPDLPSFIAAAQDFRTFCEAEGKTTRADLWKLRELLLRLIYHIPAVEQAPYDSDHDGHRPDDAACLRVMQRCGGFPLHGYNVHLEPFEIPSQEIGIASLHDDLGDIYRDLMEGLDLCNQNHVGSACFYWSLTYRSHWGQHAVQALTAIELYRTTNELSTTDEEL